MAFTRQVRIAVSMLAGDHGRFGDECRAMEAAGADWVHLDLMDGHFVPNLTFGPAVCAALRPHLRGVMDVHLMAAPVEPWIEPLARAGADIVTVHLESGPDVRRALRAIRDSGRKAGLAINPGTEVSCVAGLLDDVDLICVMTVSPGYGGQRLIPATMAKVAALRAMLGDRPVHLEVDGGVAVGNARALVAAGADVLVAGAAMFRGGSPERPEVYAENIRVLRRAAGG